MSFTYYELLGVSPKASGMQIKKAYKQRAKQIHPDVVHDDEALWKMKRLNRAYSVLRNNSRRAEYDASLSMTGHYQCEVEQSESSNMRWLKVSLLWLVAVAVIGFFSHPVWEAQLSSLAIFR